MGKKILDSKALYVVLSIVLTVCIWCYVASTDGTPRNDTYSAVPVVFEGLDILEDRGLMIVDDDVTATVRALATPAVHARLSEGLKDGALTVTVNVSGISGEGPHSLAYTVNRPAGVGSSDVSFLSTTGSSTVSIDVARFLRREIPIKGSFQGSAAEGYLAGNDDDFMFSPDTIWISGQADLVNQVAEARVTITDTELTDPVSGDYRFQLIGVSGDPLDLDVTCDVDTVYLNFPVLAMAEIPLEVKLNPGGGLSESDVRVELSTDSIIVAGSKDAVTALSKAGAITLSAIELSSVRDGDELTLPVPLADELTNLSGISEVKVSITVKKRVVSQTFAATNIQYIHEPAGWNVDIVTKELAVEIRGTQKLMDELTQENIRVVADLQNINQAAGQYTIPVTIHLDSAGSKAEIGEMAGNYSIVVTLTPA